jgi:osmotically-inducible protein OsmY
MKRSLPLLLFLSPLLASCAVPYVKAEQAAVDPRSVLVQARDQRLQMELRRVVVEDESFSGLTISPHVFMERGFLVGFVDSEGQADSVLAASQSVEGLRSVQGYLPVRPATDSTAADLELKGEIKAAIGLHPPLVVSRYTVEVLDGHVVLLGVVESEEERDSVARVAAGVSGVVEVQDFLLVVEPGFESLRPHLR